MGIFGSLDTKKQDAVHCDQLKVRERESSDDSKESNTLFRGISSALRFHLGIIVLITLKIVLQRLSDRKQRFAFSF